MTETETKARPLPLPDHVFTMLVTDLEAEGMSRPDAIRAAVHRAPAQHESWLRSLNSKAAA